jgi:hypothetical protein
MVNGLIGQVRLLANLPHPPMRRGAHAVPLFVVSYLAVCALVGVAVYAVYRPHGPVAAGAVAIGAGAYEFTPLKQHVRRRCRESASSGFGFGLCCVGSSIGLMAMLVALSVKRHLDGRDRRPRRRPEALPPPKPPSMCRWGWRSSGSGSSSSSRLRWFQGSPRRCESVTGGPGPSCNDKKNERQTT